jgi:hypothetical protein
VLEVRDSLVRECDPVAVHAASLRRCPGSIQAPRRLSGASTGRSAERRAVGGEGVSRRVPCEGKQQRLDRQLMPEQDDLVRAPSSAPICPSARPAEAREERHVEERPDHARPPELGRAKVEPPAKPPPLKPRTSF